MDYANTNSEYFQRNPTWQVQDSPWKAAQVLTMLTRNRLTPKSVADVGCGAGEVLNQLYQRMEDKSVRFYGYEVSPDAIKLCRQRENDRLAYFMMPLSEVKEHFDLLLMLDVFEHVDDYRGFIAQCNNKADYKLYHIPLDMSAVSVITKWPMHERETVGHIHYFMKDTALAALADSKQNVVDWFYTRFPSEPLNRQLSLLGNAVNLLRWPLFKIKPDLCVRMLGGYSLMVLTK
jgi:SAM-dependent methyltransferase